VDVAKDPSEADGTLEVQYWESRGEDYDIGGTGSTVHLEVRVKDKEVLPLTFSGSTPYSLEVDLFQDLTRQYLMAAIGGITGDEGFSYLGHFTAAALGDRDAARRLLTGIFGSGIQAEILSLLETVGCEPEGPEEQAYLLLAEDKYEECVALGAAAVPAMIDFAAGEPHQIVAEWLGRIGGPEAHDVLVEWLQTFRPYRERDMEELEDWERAEEEYLKDDWKGVAAVLRALGASGDMEDLFLVGRFAGDDRKEVAAAVAEARAALLERSALQAPGGEKPAVVLRIRAWSWLPRRFNIEKALRERFEEAGLTVLDADAKEADAVVSASYREDRGMSEGFVAITCGVRVLDARDGTTFEGYEAAAETPMGDLHGDTTQAAAIRALLKAESFLRMGDAVAAVLGDGEALSRLIPCAVIGETHGAVLALVEKTGYEPATDAEKAFLAVARGDFEESLRLGKAAAVPVAGILKWESEWNCTAGYHAAAQILGKDADREAMAGLIRGISELLRESPPEQEEPACPEYEDEEEFREIQAARAKEITALIGALESIGAKARVGMIKVYLKDWDPAVAEAARKAVEALK
jgi:hypothetical protein